MSNMVTMRDIDELKEVIIGLQNVVGDLVTSNLRTTKMIAELTKRVKKLETDGIQVSIETTND